MSKLSPLGQSMAAIFSPEASKQRSTAQAAASSGAIRVPGASPLQSHKSQDSLGNPNSPGYDGPPQKKKKSPLPDAAPASSETAPAAPPPVFETPSEGAHVIRLGAGWEKLLLAQKKICEKAKGLFTMLEGPGKYNGQKRNRGLLSKSRGCIVDLQVNEHGEGAKPGEGNEKKIA